MSGIYLHIPYCKKACHYCNFHFSTQLKHIDDFLEALLLEINLRKSYLGATQVDTIYFGGGTPSVLDGHQIDRILSSLHNAFDIADACEVCLEANPDDLDLEYLQELKSVGVNRLSIGIQSFFDDDLTWMNRSHNASQAFDCIKNARSVGFENFSIDLIFGSPSSSGEKWFENIKQAKEMAIPHISCYGLTVEPRTALHHMVEKGKVEKPRDEEYVEQFEVTQDYLSEHGYDHYEISNYALAGFVSKHNSNYWKSVPYLGLGPSAHSFNGESRSWNVANNIKYINAIKEGLPFTETELLEPKDRYNEFVMTGLRTVWGCDEEDLNKFDQVFIDHFVHHAQIQISKGNVFLEERSYKLTRQGKAIANDVISELFFV